MENNNKIAVGLDIGTTKIVAMIGRKNEFGKIEVVGYGRSKSVGVKRGVVVNIMQTIQSIQQAIEEAEASSGIKISNVTVGIAGQHIRSLHHSDYIMRPNSETVINSEDIENLTSQVYKLGMMPGEEIIHVIPQEFKVDTEPNVSEPIGMFGGRLEANFHVVVGQGASIRNIGSCITSAGLKLGSITLEPLASAEAVLSDEEKEAGVALIDIGGGTTDLAIFKDGIIRHTAVIPFGGNVITNDIKEGCLIIEKQAELLKVKFGSTWPAENKDSEIVSIPGLRGREPKEITLKNLSKIIHARTTEIVEQVFQEIKKYGHDTKQGRLIAGIVITGGGAQVKHLKQLVEYITGLNTRIGFPNEHLAHDSDEELSSPIFATSVGLLMSGLEHLEKTKKAKEIEDEIEKRKEIEEKKNQPDPIVQKEKPPVEVKPKKNTLERWADRFKEFLENAE